MTILTRPLTLDVNGQRVGPHEVPDDLMLLDFLHEYANLTGSRYACGIGVCYACAVIVDHPDGRTEKVASCITGAHYCAGRKVRTIEGVAQTRSIGQTALSDVQRAYLEHFSFQCSYCTPGFVMGATALLEELRQHPVPRDRVEDKILSAMNMHICRCTGYVRYLAAIKDVILKTPGLTTDGRVARSEAR